MSAPQPSEQGQEIPEDVLEKVSDEIKGWIGANRLDVWEFSKSILRVAYPTLLARLKALEAERDDAKSVCLFGDCKACRGCVEAAEQQRDQAQATLLLRDRSLADAHAEIRQLRGDEKRWRAEAEESNSVIDWCVYAVNGVELSEFALSFAVVRSVADVVQQREKLEAEVARVQEMSSEYIKRTDPMLSCGPSDDPAAGKCGTCRCCYIERAEKAEAEVASLREHEQDLGAAYLRLRLKIPGALYTPPVPTPQQAWQTTDQALDALLGKLSQARALHENAIVVGASKVREVESELAQARAELQTLQESQTFVSLSRQAAASFQGGRLSRNDEVEKLKSRLLEALALLKEVTVHQDRTGTVDPWWPGWRTRVDALTQERG